jgi:hypothetical protein
MVGMKKKARYNLDSPNSIKAPCEMGDLGAWFRKEAQAVEDEAVRQVVLDVVERLDSFLHWPGKAILLWPQCERRKYHSYPKIIKNAVKLIVTKARFEELSEVGKRGSAAPRCSVLDTRANGPAVTSFVIAGGERPRRFGSNNYWSIHHLYSGKFPYVGNGATLHAVKKGLHFTQSAGLVAIHPIADQMCDEFPAFAWLLRALAFKTFGYDPDQVFSNDPHDHYGFVGKTCFVIPQEAINGKETETD